MGGDGHGQGRPRAGLAVDGDGRGQEHSQKGTAVWCLLAAVAVGGFDQGWCLLVMGLVVGADGY